MCGLCTLDDAVVVDVLRAYAMFDQVAIRGSIAIYYVSAGNSRNKRLFVEAGAVAVLRAIEVDRASSAEAKSYVRDALNSLV